MLNILLSVMRIALLKPKISLKWNYQVNPIILQYGEEIQHLGYVPPKRFLLNFNINFQVTFSDKTIYAKDYTKDCTPKKLIIGLDNFSDNIYIL